MAQSTEERFWKKVDKTGDCWIWTAARWDGYGKFWFNGKKLGYAHRWSYEQAIGPIPNDLNIDHLCRNRACVNPDHLEAVTPQINTNRSPIAISAINARKTHCIRGHPFNQSNTYLRPNGRECRTCWTVRPS